MKALLAGIIVIGGVAAAALPGGLMAQGLDNGINASTPDDADALVVSIPNHRSEADARRQVDKALSGIQHDYGSFFTIKYRHWTGNRLRLRASLLGQPAVGYIDVERTHVDVRIRMPGSMTFITDMAQPAILKAGTKMLAKK